MAKTMQQVVHESEAQRQYVRVPIPARVEIKDATYRVKDLSSGGIGIVDVEGGYEKGETLRMLLILPFHEFSLDINLETQVQSYAKKDKLLGARFVNLTPSQISLVNHVIRSYISGDVVGAGDIMDVAQRSDFMRVRKQANEAGRAEKSASFIGNILPVFLIAVIGLIAFYVITLNIYDDLFIVSSNTGVVKAETLVFSSPVAGIYSERVDRSAFSVDRGAEIAGITLPATQTEKSLSYSLASPCDCTITKRYAYTGEYLAQGAPVFDMAPSDKSPYVEVFIEADNVSKIGIGDQARMRIAGTDVEVGGQVHNIIFNEAAIAGVSPFSKESMIKLIVQPSEKLPIGFVGRPVSTEFTLF